MSTKPDMPEPELSYPLPIDKIPAAGIIKTIDANEVERKRLAARFGLLDLPSLRAELTAQSARAGQAIKVTGHLTADVVQRCGVTNEPVPDHIEHDIEIFYTTDAAEEGQDFVDPNDVETEPVIDGVIELGELVAQNLGIALNPYPRKPGVVFEAVIPEEIAVPASPLAKLAELTKKSKDKSNR